MNFIIKRGKYKKSVTRECSLFDVRAWYEGESKELKKLTNVGFFNHIFVSKNGLVTIYYNIEESEKFDEWLEENFTEEFFNELCDDFFDLVCKIDNVQSNEEIFDLYVQMWPALTFFDELSKYPEWGNDAMIRRLIRVRKSTELVSYELGSKAVVENLPQNYIFFKGKIYYQDFGDFCKENEIEIIDENE